MGLARLQVRLLLPPWACFAAQLSGLASINRRSCVLRSCSAARPTMHGVQCPARRLAPLGMHTAPLGPHPAIGGSQARLGPSAEQARLQAVCNPQPAVT